MAIVVERPKLKWYEYLFIPALVKGMRITLGHFFKTLRGGSKVTMQYPEEKWDANLPEHYRGAPALVTDEQGRAEALAFDVTNRDEVCERLAGQNFDIVVNNAGNAGAFMMQPVPFRDMDPELWAAPIDVNLYGVMNTAHAALRGMCERGFGRLITISSGALPDITRVC